MQIIGSFRVSATGQDLGSRRLWVKRFVMTGKLNQLADEPRNMPHRLQRLGYQDHLCEELLSGLGESIQRCLSKINELQHRYTGLVISGLFAPIMRGPVF